MPTTTPVILEVHSEQAFKRPLWDAGSELFDDSVPLRKLCTKSLRNFLGVLEYKALTTLVPRILMLDLV
jgi:hypothetical protein